MTRDQLEAIRLRPIEPAQVRVRRVTYRRKPRDALGQRRNETVMFDERRREIEKLDVFAVLNVFTRGSAAETVDFRGLGGIYHWEHSFMAATGFP